VGGFGRRGAPAAILAAPAAPSPLKPDPMALSAEAKAFAAQLPDTASEPEVSIQDWQAQRRLERRRTRGPWRLAALAFAGSAAIVQYVAADADLPIWLLRGGAAGCAVMALVSWRRAIDRRVLGGG